MTAVEFAEGIIVPDRPTGDGLTAVVTRLVEMFTDHVESHREKVRELTERIEDLEGHIEHGPDGSCGMCTETVGADEYGQIITADFESECANYICRVAILPGDEIVEVYEGTYVHDHC